MTQLANLEKTISGLNHKIHTISRYGDTLFVLASANDHFHAYAVWAVSESGKSLFGGGYHHTFKEACADLISRASLPV